MVKLEEEGLEIFDNFDRINDTKNYFDDFELKSNNPTNEYKILTADEEKEYGNKLKLINNLNIISSNEGKKCIDINKVILLLSKIKNKDTITLCLLKIKKILLTYDSDYNYNDLNKIKKYEELFKNSNHTPTLEEVSKITTTNINIITDNNEDLLTQLDKYLEYINAFNKFIYSNQKLVLSVAYKYKQYTNIDLQDLVSEGNVGLITAINKFDIDKGNKFSTYAYWWIMQNITRYIYVNNINIKVPQEIIIKAKKYRNDLEQLEKEKGRKLSIEEISKKLKIDKSIIFDYMIANSSYVSLDEPINESDDFTYGDLISEQKDNSIDEKVNRLFLKEEISVLFENLSDIEKNVIKLRFGLGENEGKTHTLQDIGKMMNISKDSVRMIEKKSLVKMRYISAKNPKARSLKLYLK